MKTCSVINFTLRTTLVVSHKFWYLIFSFSFSFGVFFTSLELSSLTHKTLRNVLFNFKCLKILLFLSIIDSSLIPLWSKYTLYFNSYTFFRVEYCGLAHGLSWSVFLWTWEKMCILLCVKVFLKTLIIFSCLVVVFNEIDLKHAIQ